MKIPTWMPDGPTRAAEVIRASVPSVGIIAVHEELLARRHLRHPATDGRREPGRPGQERARLGAGDADLGDRDEHLEQEPVDRTGRLVDLGLCAGGLPRQQRGHHGHEQPEAQHQHGEPAS